MKNLIIKYKSVIKFILTFLLVYGVLIFAYNYYLDASKGGKYYPDYITNLVANQSKDLLENVGYS
ncbi:MAG: exosortase family protein XrtF, partial [Olleya sp.]